MVADAGWLLGAITRELTLFAAIGLLIGGIDDLAVDLCWIGRTLWRRATVFRHHERATMATLPRPSAPGRIAIMIPAWHEKPVIAHMLRAALSRIEHDDYLLYVGTYPNDPGTQAAVRSVGDRRVRLVGGERDGPTTKAECLNRIWRAIEADEVATGVRIKAIILHDAEDVMHPCELALFDRMIERFDMVQIPVIPLANGVGWWARMVSSTYIDEFAEAHGRVLGVREAIGAGVPSAGVGTAISRAAMGRIAAEGGGAPFDEGSLTEDYELGLRLKAAGGRGVFVTIPVAPGKGPVAVCAAFPASFDGAVRQKARWLQGIALAGWDRLRWQGGLAERWMRLRDRRSILAAIVLTAAYGGGLLSLLCLALGITPVWPPAMPMLLAVTTTLTIWRIMMRMTMVAWAHGWRQGLWSLPRLFVANAIAIAAARRAVTAYIPGAAPRWDKTTHAFPDTLPCD